MIQAIRSLAFALIFYPGTFVFVLVGLAASLFGSGPTRAVVNGWSNFHHWVNGNVLGVRTKVEGAIPTGPYLIAVKHQSMFETIELLQLVDTPVIVLKRELYDLPFFGWMTGRYGVIPVDREAGPKALREMVAAGKRAVADGRPVAIFPEGTRVMPGDTPPLRPGFAGLYRTLGLAVVPVAVDSGRLWGRGLVKRSGTVTFRVGQVIPAGLKRAEIEERVHAAINSLEKPSAAPRSPADR